MKRRQWQRNERRRSWRRHAKTKDKESPLCCIDGHPQHPKVRVHPGECSQEHSQVWKILLTQLTWMVRNIPNRYTIEELYTNFTEEVDGSNYGSLLRKRQRTSTMCVANLHSLPWKITSMVHKIRTTLKRRWIFKRASGNRCLHDAGKTRPPRKAAAAAAAAATIPCQ